MNAELEIIIPVCHPDGGLSRTAASLIAQTDRNFSVLLGENHSRAESGEVEAAEKKLKSAGIAAKRLRAPDELQRAEHWNWTHAQSRAAWLKPLFPGEELKPAFVERVRRRIAKNPRAQLIRCDAELQTEWGRELLAAPFEKSSVSAAEVLDYFPAQMDWLSPSLPFAYGRTAWLALGGFAPQLPACAVLNLNVLFALHFGMENIAETLAAAQPKDGSGLNETTRVRVNHSLELWFILRQARNYCLAARLPWPEQCLLWRGLSAAMGRW